MCQLQTQEAVSDATTEIETNTIPGRQWTLSNEATRLRQLRAARMSSKAAARGMNLLQLRAIGPQTRQNYAAYCLTFECGVRRQGKRVETDTEIDAAMSIWIEATFMEKSCKLRSAAAQWFDQQVPRFHSTRGGSKLPKT